MNAALVVAMAVSRLCGESFADYQRAVAPKLEHTTLALACYDAMEPLRFGFPVYENLNGPPRFGKTTSFNLIAAKMVSHSHFNFGYAPYGDALAEEQSDNVKRIVRDTGYHILKGRDRKDEWIVEETGSRLRFAGVEAGWTGKGFDWIHFDDPLKGRNESRSAAVRKSVWSSMYSDLRTRLDDWLHGSFSCMQTRWHIDDPSGRILAGGFGFPFNHTKLAALRPDGTSLDPRRFPLDVLARIRSGGEGECSGEYDWWSLYMQEPRPEGSALFREPKRFDLAAFLNDPQRPLSSYRWALGVDPAATAKTSADHSAAILIAFEGTGADTRAWVVDVFHQQVEIPELVNAIVRMRRQWADRGAAARVGVESVAGFKAVPQMMRRVMPAESVIDIRAASDKFTRAQPVAMAWNEGRVMVPDHAPWADKLIHQCSLFTGLEDPHDDLVDALAHAFTMQWKSRPELVRGLQPLRIHTMG